jgi:BNR repeat-like domain
VVDRESGQYLGHPSTVLLEDGRTVLCVYPKGHGRGPIILKRSMDGGRTWSPRLPVPENWATSLETPTIHRVVDASGKRRLIVWSGMHPARIAVSEDDGATWSSLRKAGDWGGIVVMGFVEPVREQPGRYLAMFHDDGRFFTAKNLGREKPVFTVYKTFSNDGGLTWSSPESVFASDVIHLCEPGCVRSPGGKRLAVLLRENSRRKNAHIIFSDDEGVSWTAPKELPAALTGDRHVGRYTDDGRLFIAFRDTTLESPTWGDWVGWLGHWEDLVQGTEGRARVRLMRNHQDADCAYTGLEHLPDGRFLAVTYGHWTAGEPPYIMAVRFGLDDIESALAPRP